MNSIAGLGAIIRMGTDQSERYLTSSFEWLLGTVVGSLSVHLMKRLIRLLATRLEVGQHGNIS